MLPLILITHWGLWKYIWWNTGYLSRWEGLGGGWSLTTVSPLHLGGVEASRSGKSSNHGPGVQSFSGLCCDPLLHHWYWPPLLMDKLIRVWLGLGPALPTIDLCHSRSVSVQQFLECQGRCCCRGLWSAPLEVAHSASFYTFRIVEVVFSRTFTSICGQSEVEEHNTQNLNHNIYIFYAENPCSIEKSLWGFTAQSFIVISQFYIITVVSKDCCCCD